MALNLAAPPPDPVQQTANKRQFSRSLVGDFTLDHERAQHRHKILLSRNMTRVLAFHEKQRVQEPDSHRRSSTRQQGPYFGHISLKGGSGIHGISVGPTLPSKLPSSASGHITNELGHDTSKPELESVSKDCLKVKTQMEAFDTPKRRSLRRQLVNQHEDKDAHLNLNILNIRKKLNFKETAGEYEGRPRKRTKRDAIACHCHVTIWDNRNGLDLKDPIIRKSELCEVVTSSSEDGHLTADIKLERPFVIQSRELRVAVEGAGGSALALSDNYFLEIKIIPATENVQWPPIPILGKSEGDQSTHLGQLAAEKLQGSLVMRYLHLPQAPAQDIPLSVFFLRDGKTYRSKYGLEVKSSWTIGPPQDLVKTEGDQKLGLWAIDEADLPFGRRQPPGSKASSVRSDAAPVSQPKVIYNIDPVGAREAKEFRRATVKGFQCPACPAQKWEELNQLQYHFLTCHPKYKFIIEKETRAPLTEKLTSLSFKVMAASNPKPRNSDREKRDQEGSWLWQAPNEPFNIDAFVEGDVKWMAEQPKKKPTLNGGVASLVVDPSSALRKQYGGFLPVEFVPPFRPAARKKYPGVRLNTLTEEKSTAYTSVSHRQRHPSEDPQSETDDEINSAPFVQKSQENLDVTAEKNGWSAEDRMLRSKWNKARFDEQLSHPRYLSDCLIRFVRAEKDWLARGGALVSLALNGLLHDLLVRRVINDEVTRDVWLILHDDDSDANEMRNNTSASREVEMKDADTSSAAVIFPSVLTREDQAEALLALPEFSCGICIEYIVDVNTRGMPCSDLTCDAPGVWYHARCARCKISDRADWKCPLCQDRNGSSSLDMT